MSNTIKKQRPRILARRPFFGLIGGPAGVGKQFHHTTPWPTGRHGSHPPPLPTLFASLNHNAIKYGADGKRILVKVHAEDEIVAVSVVNYGHVIPEQELPLIFNKFYRVEQSRSSSTGGTGLGLAIAKNIVEMHGGAIQVESDLNGTVFTVKLKVHFDVSKENFGKIE